MERCTIIKPSSKRAPGTGHWEKGSSGNPAGRPRGSRNRANVFLEAIGGMAQDDLEELLQKTTELAKQGERWALKLVIDRRLPRLKGRLIQLRLPRIRSERDAVIAYDRIYQAVTRGEITIAEALAFDELVSRRLSCLRQRGQADIARYRSHNEESIEDPEWEFQPLEDDENLPVGAVFSVQLPNDCPQAIEDVGAPHVEEYADPGIGNTDQPQSECASELHAMTAALTPAQISQLTNPADPEADSLTHAQSAESIKENPGEEEHSRQSAKQPTGPDSGRNSRAEFLPKKPEPVDAGRQREQTERAAGQESPILQSSPSSDPLASAVTKDGNAAQPGELLPTHSPRRNESTVHSHGAPATPAPAPSERKPEPAPPPPPVDPRAAAEAARLRRPVGRLAGARADGTDFGFLITP